MPPKQSERVLTEVRRLLRVQDYQKWFAVQPKRADSLWVRFQPAGHILGSAYVEIRRPNGEVVVFSGIWGQAIRLCCLIRSRQSGQIICLLKPLMAISSTRMCRAEGSGCAR